MFYNKEVKWNESKNEMLIMERNISFEEVLFYIDNGNHIDTIENPKRKGQKKLVININK